MRARLIVPLLRGLGLRRFLHLRPADTNFRRLLLHARPFDIALALLDRPRRGTRLDMPLLLLLLLVALFARTVELLLLLEAGAGSCWVRGRFQ